MTDSMIPYSFVPGTKAKADEVNANFISLANFIEKNKNSSANDIEKINQVLKNKADKEELINEHTITEAETNLDDYKTKGTYIFSNLYKPTNIPKGEAGMLIVTGDEQSVIKQVWYCSGENPEIFTRDYENETWGEWYSNNGIFPKTNPGYMKLPNGLIIQWGFGSSSEVTYPIAFNEIACPVYSKQGYNGNLNRSDSGTVLQLLTGFSYLTCGDYYFLNWIAVGY